MTKLRAWLKGLNEVIEVFGLITCGHFIADQIRVADYIAEIERREKR